MTLEQVAALVGVVTRERIRQIEVEALAKLRRRLEALGVELSDWSAMDREQAIGDEPLQNGDASELRSALRRHGPPARRPSWFPKRKGRAA